MDDHAHVVSWLSRGQLFSRLQPAELAVLAPEFQRVDLASPRELFHQGDPGDAIFLVVSGRLEVLVSRDDREFVVRELFAGALIGEMAVITGERRSATIRAARDTILLRLGTDGFARLVASNPALMMEICKVIVSRQDSEQTPLAETPGMAIAAIRVGQSTELSESRWAALEVLQQLGDTAIIHEATFQERLEALEGVVDPAQGASMLRCQLERQHDFVIYIAEADAPEWALSCARQADRVLLLALAGGDLALTPLERDLAASNRRNHARLEAILVHPAAPVEARWTHSWLEGRNVDVLHTLRAGRKADIEHLVRRVVGLEDSLAWLRSSALFCDFDDRSLRALLPEFDWRSLSAGHVLIEQGAEGRSLFIIASGRLQAVLRDAEGKGQVLRDLRPGDVVGEVGLISGEPRTAEIRAVRDALVVELSIGAFERLAQRFPRLARRLSEVAVRRMTRGEDRSVHTAGTATTLTVVPLDSEVDLSAFCAQMTKALSEQGPATTVDARRTDERIGEGSASVGRGEPGDAVIVQYLSNLEHEHRFVVYQADGAPTPWTQRCLRQADHILLVADATGSPALRPREAELYVTNGPSALVPTDLVLVQPSDITIATGTARWLDSRDLNHHFHVRRGHPEDFARLSRLATRSGVGLALGGGGSRGVAHLGVQRALDAAEVPIDAYVGTSVGALVGAALAAGMDHETAMALSNDLLGGRAAHLASVGPPFVSVMSGHAMNRVLRRALGDRQIEDLLIPFRAVSVDLFKGCVHLIDRGDVASAVRASTSLPGVWPPVHRPDGLYVDGGVLNNLPADALSGLCAGGAIIASDVSGDAADVEYRQYADAISGWGIFLRALLAPFLRLPRYPYLLPLMERCIILGSLQRKEDVVVRHVDLYVRPSVGHLGIFEVRNPAAIAAVEAEAFETSRAVLDGWDWRTARRRG